ncbi:hypothetical protein BM1_02042 [Bipolaris maydis]|nr:hypothetical protein BM1_02042 [Bipolaris maydis]
MSNPQLTTIIEETSSAGTTTTQDPSSTPPGSVQQVIVPGDTDDWHCSDFLHCLGEGDPEGIIQCDAATEQVCPGLGAANLNTPNSYVNNGVHAGENRTRTCGNCRLHEGHPAFPDKRALINSYSNVDLGSGMRSQLCRSCIYDEVELYWLRQGTLNPMNARSSPHIRQWPAPNGYQNLCMCEGWTVDTPAIDCCHACRDILFFEFCFNPFHMTEDVLHSCVQPVIKGTRLYVNRDHGRSMRVSAATVLKRRQQGIGRMCPCGNKPKKPSVQEYITYSYPIIFDNIDSETSTVCTSPTICTTSPICTPPTTNSNPATSKDPQKWENFQSSIPWPGRTFIIRSHDTGQVITFLDGEIILDKPGGFGTFRWRCVERRGWLGFRDPVSARYMGVHLCEEAA